MRNGDEWFDPGKFARVIVGLEGKIGSLDLSVEYGTDFAWLESSLKHEGKQKLTEHFQTELNTYTPQIAMWLRVCDTDQNTVACIAARVDELGSENLAEHVSKYWRRCYPGVSDGQALAAKHQPRFLSEISGRVAYLGDLWVAREHQRKKLHNWLTPLAMTIALQRWRPDWIYCWIRPSHWSKRYPMAYGFSAVHPRGIEWEQEPATIDPNLVMGVNHRNWALDWVDRLADELLTVSRKL